jgi:cytoplasmic iron level regulating protein YaaA (DUF328/UPF0246 family)
VPRAFSILLPPSESKRPGGSRSAGPGRFDAALGAARSEVTGALGELLRTAPPRTLEKVLNVRAALLERALGATSDLVAGRAAVLPAWQRYSGVVWAHLEAGTLSVAQRRRLLVPSGLYGMTTAQDPIGDYRLKMDVSLVPLGNLAAYWRPVLTPVLAAHLGGATVVDLLPKEHEAALDLAALATTCRVVTVRFVSADGVAAAGHGAKAVKGILARQVLLEGLDVLDSFSWEGWRSHRRGDITRVVAPLLAALDGRGVREN